MGRIPFFCSKRMRWFRRRCCFRMRTDTPNAGINSIIFFVANHGRRFRSICTAQQMILSVLQLYLSQVHHVRIFTHVATSLTNRNCPIFRLDGIRRMNSTLISSRIAQLYPIAIVSRVQQRPSDWGSLGVLGKEDARAHNRGGSPNNKPLTANSTDRRLALTQSSLRGKRRRR